MSRREGQKKKTDRSFTKEEGPRHDEDMQEQPVRKATRIRINRGRARLPYNAITRSKTSRTPGQRQPRYEAWPWRSQMSAAVDIFGHIIGGRFLYAAATTDVGRLACARVPTGPVAQARAAAAPTGARLSCAECQM